MTLFEMQPRLAEATSLILSGLILSGEELDAIAYSRTSDSVMIGDDISTRQS